MTKRVFIFLYFTIIWLYNCVASEPDSLIKALKDCKTDTTKFKLEMKLVFFYISKNNYTNAKMHAVEANKLASKINNTELIVQSNAKLGGIYRELNQYDSAFTYLFKNIKISESKNNNQQSSEAYTIVGALFLRMKNYNKAEFYYKKTLKIKEGSQDKKTIAEVYSKLATVKVAQKKYDEAVEYLVKAEKLIEGLKEPIMLANVYGNLGRISLEKGDFDKAILFLEKTEKLGFELNSNQILTRCYSFLSKVYLDKFNLDHKSTTINKALYYAERNYNIVDQIEDDNAKCVAAGSLYNIHKLTGNSKEALKYHEIYTALNDTLTQLDNNRYVADINFKYETEKQERRINKINTEKEMSTLALEVEKQTSRNNIYVSLVIGLIVILGGGLLFINYKQKQKQAFIQLENEKLTADLNFLKAQVDPHTIFNTINTIHGQLGIDVKSGRENLVKFSELMHYQLYECGDKYVDIEKEIQHLSKYVELQKLRKSGRMELKFNLDAELNQVFIAPLLFIPLVENAFKYANTNSEGKYFIHIDLHKSGNTIKFTCVNSYTKKQEEQKPKKGGGIGLDNLKKRLEALYKNKYTLTIHPTDTTFNTILEIHV